MERTIIPTVSGIYKLESIINANIYIGSTTDLKRRRRDHFRMLRDTTHYNPYLQRRVNKYGVGDLQFKIVLLCEKEELIKNEQYYIDTLEPKFNIAKNAQNVMLGRHHSNKSKRKASRSNKGQVPWSKGLVLDNHPMKTDRVKKIVSDGVKTTVLNKHKKIAEAMGKIVLVIPRNNINNEYFYVDDCVFQESKKIQKTQLWEWWKSKQKEKRRVAFINKRIAEHQVKAEELGKSLLVMELYGQRHYLYVDLNKRDDLRASLEEKQRLWKLGKSTVNYANASLLRWSNPVIRKTLTDSLRGLNKGKIVTKETRQKIARKVEYLWEHTKTYTSQDVRKKRSVGAKIGWEKRRQKQIA